MAASTHCTWLVDAARHVVVVPAPAEVRPRLDRGTATPGVRWPRRQVERVRGPRSSPTDRPGDGETVRVTSRPRRRLIGNIDSLRGPYHTPSSNLLHRLGTWSANPVAGVTVACLLVAWGVVGIAAGFPSWWQVALYSTTSAVTVVMVFAIQHTQHREQLVTQRKLDELLTRPARSRRSPDRRRGGHRRRAGRSHRDERALSRGRLPAYAPLHDPGFHDPEKSRLLSTLLAEDGAERVEACGHDPVPHPQPALLTRHQPASTRIFMWWLTVGCERPDRPTRSQAHTSSPPAEATTREHPQPDRIGEGGERPGQQLRVRLAERIGAHRGAAGDGIEGGNRGAGHDETISKGHRRSPLTTVDALGVLTA